MRLRRTLCAECVCVRSFVRLVRIRAYARRASLVATDIRSSISAGARRLGLRTQLCNYTQLLSPHFILLTALLLALRANFSTQVNFASRLQASASASAVSSCSRRDLKVIRAIYNLYTACASLRLEALSTTCLHICPTPHPSIHISHCDSTRLDSTHSNDSPAPSATSHRCVRQAHAPTHSPTPSVPLASRRPAAVLLRPGERRRVVWTERSCSRARERRTKQNVLL